MEGVEERNEGRQPSRIERVSGVLAGLVIGPLLGFYVTIAVFVARARQGHYLFSLHDVMEPRWELLPTMVGLLGGAWIGGMGIASVARVSAWCALGAVVFALPGWPIGDLVWRDPSGPWAGAAISAAVGLAAGLGFALRSHTLAGLRALKHKTLGRRRLSDRALGVSVLVLGLFTASCDNASTPDFSDVEGVALPDPAEVDAALFILGDGGATSEGASPVLAALRQDVEHWSSSLARDSAVSVLYPGDVVYPVGVRDREHPEFETDSVRLWNQIRLIAGEAAREHSSLGLFLAGNHDWGNATGPAGLSRLANLEEQLALAREGGLKAALHPAAGHPGPAIRDLRDVLRLVMIDVHWFLQARSAGEKNAFFDRVREALVSAGGREVIIVAHHPYRSAGPHGTLLPGPRALGIPYLLKKTGTLVQDLDSPVYGEFIRRLRLTFIETGRPPLAFVGGHDHSLQVLSGLDAFDPRFALVSGSGSKVTPISTTEGMEFGASRPGYMMLLVTRSGDVLLYVVAGDPDQLKCDGLLSDEDAVRGCMQEAVAKFEVAYSAVLKGGSHDPGRFVRDSIDGWTTSPWLLDVLPRPSADLVAALDPSAADSTDRRASPPSRPLTEDERRIVSTGPPPAVPLRMLDRDSVTASPGARYEAGPIRRFLMGDLHRDLWSVPFTVPVLDLDTLDGGAIADELSGGKQTLGLRLTTEGGRTFQFRSMVKDASRTVPSPIEGTPLQGLVRDQFAAQFPLSALVVAELLEAVDVLVAKPTPVVLPDDPRLGPYREAFAGRMGWIELRPNEAEGDRPGFAGSSKITGSEELYEELATDPSSYVDVRKLMRARLIDILVGDWDRHSDQWRWASFEEGDSTRWEPIPRDRDWALVQIDGLLPTVAGLLMSKYVGFGEELPKLSRLISSADHLETRLLGDVDRATFLEVGAGVQAALTDSVIDRAVGVLPASYRSAIGEEIEEALKERRDRLTEIAEAWYAIRARTAVVYGTGQPDDVSVSQERGLLEVRVTSRSPSGGREQTRVIRPSVTRVVRLVLDSLDTVSIAASPSGLRIECARDPNGERVVPCW